MATIKFKAKVQTVYNMDDTIAYQYIEVPEVKRTHCDMNSFRKHPFFGPYANSDLFFNLIRRQFIVHKIGPVIRLDRVPEAMTIDTSGFLAAVTVEL